MRPWNTLFSDFPRTRYLTPLIAFLRSFFLEKSDLPRPQAVVYRPAPTTNIPRESAETEDSDETE